MRQSSASLVTLTYASVRPASERQPERQPVQMTASVLSLAGSRFLLWLLPERTAADVVEFIIRYSASGADGFDRGRPAQYLCPYYTDMPAAPSGHRQYCWQLQAFAPGTYQITVSASSRSGQAGFSSRPVTFAVVAAQNGSLHNPSRTTKRSATVWTFYSYHRVPTDSSFAVRHG